MNVLDLLKQDHHRVKALLDQASQADEFTEKKRLFREIKQELDVHAHLEETMFYPLFQDRDEFKQIIKDSFEEHQEVRTLLDEGIRITSADDLDEKIDELTDNVQHHVDDEENKLFPKVRNVMSEEELVELGNRVEAAKKSQRGSERAA